MTHLFVGKKGKMLHYIENSGIFKPLTEVVCLNPLNIYNNSNRLNKNFADFFKTYTQDNTKKIESVELYANSAGKGTSSNIKKNKFKRGPETHGSKHHRLQGSLGAGTNPGRVFPGKKMPGKLGNTKVTLKKLCIYNYNEISNTLTLIGSIPGKKNNKIFIIFK